MGSLPEEGDSAFIPGPDVQPTGSLRRPRMLHPRQGCVKGTHPGDRAGGRADPAGRAQVQRWLPDLKPCGDDCWSPVMVISKHVGCVESVLRSRVSHGPTTGSFGEVDPPRANAGLPRLRERYRRLTSFVAGVPPASGLRG